MNIITDECENSAAIDSQLQSLAERLIHFYVKRYIKPLNEGDQVYGLVPPGANGANAEYVCVPASNMMPKPVNMNYEEAAAVPSSKRNLYINHTYISDSSLHAMDFIHREQKSKIYGTKSCY